MYSKKLNKTIPKAVLPETPGMTVGSSQKATQDIITQIAAGI